MVGRIGILATLETAVSRVFVKTKKNKNSAPKIRILPINYWVLSSTWLLLRHSRIYELEY